MRSPSLQCFAVRQFRCKMPISKGELLCCDREDETAAALTSGGAFLRRVKQLCGGEAAPSAPVTRQQYQQQQQHKQQRGSHVVLRQRGCGSPEPVLALGPANARPSGQIAGRLGSGVFVGTFKGACFITFHGAGTTLFMRFCSCDACPSKLSSLGHEHLQTGIRQRYRGAHCAVLSQARGGRTTGACCSARQGDHRAHTGPWSQQLQQDAGAQRRPRGTPREGANPRLQARMVMSARQTGARKVMSVLGDIGGCPVYSQAGVGVSWRAGCTAGTRMLTEMSGSRPASGTVPRRVLVAPNGDLPLPPPRSARRRRSPRLGTPQGSPRAAGAAAAAGECRAPAGPAQDRGEPSACAEKTAGSEEQAGASYGPAADSGGGAHAAGVANRAGKERAQQAALSDGGPAGVQSEHALVRELGRGMDVHGAPTIVDCNPAGAEVSMAEEAGTEQNATHAVSRPSSSTLSSQGRSPVEAAQLPAAGAAPQQPKPDKGTQRGLGANSTVEQAAVAGVGGGRGSQAAAVEQGVTSEGAGCLQRPAVPRRQRGKRRSGKLGAAWTVRSSEEPEGDERKARISVVPGIVCSWIVQVQQCNPISAPACLQDWSVARRWRVQISGLSPHLPQLRQPSRVLRRQWQQMPRCRTIAHRRATPRRRQIRRAAGRASAAERSTMLTVLRVRTHLLSIS